MKKVGELLKTERERRGLSLHEIGMSLKINPKILQSIEDGNSAGLPAKTFLRGFIRSYAQYLRMDVEQVLNLFQQETGPIKSEESTSPSERKSESQAPVKVERLSRKSEEPAISQGNTGIKIYTIVGAIVLLLAIGFVVRMIEKYQKESEVVVVENTTPIEQPEALATPTLSTPVDGSGETTTTDSSTSTSTTLAGALVAPTTTTVSTTLPPTTTTTVKATTTTVTTTTKPPVTTTTTRPAITTTTVKATTTTVTTTTRPPTTTTTTTRPPTTTTRPPTTTTIQGGLITTPPSTTTTLKSKAGPVEVIAEATSKVSVRYNLGEGEWKIMEMSAGQMHTFKGKAGVVLEVSDGGALSVIVNGRDRGAAGSAGKATTLNYP